jgi:cytoskeletal protein CcmA (bactofilin family)
MGWFGTKQAPAPAPMASSVPPAAGAPTIIGPGLKVKGRLTGQGDVELAGRLEGECRIDGAVHVRARAAFSGELTAARVRVSGRLDGRIDAGQQLTVEAGGRVEADVATPQLVMAEGAWLVGAVRMPH